jgi:hypothetical protein
MEAESVKGKSGWDALTWFALIFMLFMGFNLLKDRVTHPSSPITHELVVPMVVGASDIGEDKKAKSLDQSAIAPPYDHYTITQGPHGFSYGHMAIDLTAGKGTKIKSPINGAITDLYVDQYGNPTLVIENRKYTITLLHGVYKGEPGDKVKLGQVVGYESNLGYTTDMSGRSCLGRDCGYHTHINIFDKHLGINLNPLEVFSK